MNALKAVSVLWSGKSTVSRRGLPTLSQVARTSFRPSSTRNGSNNSPMAARKQHYSSEGGRGRGRENTNGNNGSGRDDGFAAASRADRILARLPPYLQRYTRKLKDAPASHGVAFLVLHEITAIVPLFGLFGLFHYTSYVPIDYMMGHFGGQVAEGVQRFEKYFRRKGWFGFGDDATANASSPASDTSTAAAAPDRVDIDIDIRQRWASKDAKYRILVEVGLAYAITKVLIPVRIAVSLLATPWLAGVLTRLRRVRK